MLDVRHFGAKGDGVDDTLAIMRCVAESATQLRAMQPGGGSYMGCCPEIFFPSGKYRITSPITLNGYQSIRGEDAILWQAGNCPAIDVPVTTGITGCYQNRIVGMNIVGGTRSISFANGNVDQTKLTVRDCNLQGWTDAAIVAEGTVGDLHMSARLLIENCDFDGATILRTRCDSTRLQHCRHQFRGTLTNDNPAISNLYGVLGVADFTGTPAGASGFWIDNYASVVVEGASRFGGEYGGIPIIRDHGPPNLVNPWKGRKIIIANSQVSCGQDANPASALITLYGLPQCIRVEGCDSIVSNSIPLIKVADGYNLAADVASLGSCGAEMQSIIIRGNQFYVAQPIPSPILPFVK